LRSRVSYHWKEAGVGREYRSAASLHGHTQSSHESLSFVLLLARRYAPLAWLIAAQKRRAARCSKIALDLAGGYWTPPLSPMSAYALESAQITDTLNLAPLVSLTDHDSIDAPLQLRVVNERLQAPISFEWTLPYRETCFHIGVHNLPAASAQRWLSEMTAYAAAPKLTRLVEIMRELNREPGVLLVFNHPRWKLSRIHEQRFNFLISEFLSHCSAWLHAFELNGLRTWTENQQVAELAANWNQLIVSGGDRHGCEPNANLNLTNARTFDEFVYELRVRRQSHVLFMPQYADPLQSRRLQTFLDVIREQPGQPVGARRWDDRVYHPNAEGEPSRLSSLWPQPPVFLQQILHAAQLLESSRAHRFLRAAGRKHLSLDLELHEGGLSQ